MPTTLSLEAGTVLALTISALADLSSISNSDLNPPLKIKVRQALVTKVIDLLND